VIRAQIADATRRGIDGFVVNWYGPRAGAANDANRAFMDEATATLLREAESHDFEVALMYDEGSVSRGETDVASYQARVESDLAYARRYVESPVYLRLGGRPAVFVFSYPDVDPAIDWARVRAAIGTPVTLIDKGPNPGTPLRDAQSDGFYAWVGPSANGWDPAGMEWGEEYLRWFYATMKSAPYADKVLVGGVWPGFDDSLAPWGTTRFMSRQGGGVYEATWRIAQQEDASVVMIATYNDVEEGTDIEFGIEMLVDMEDARSEILVRSSPVTATWDALRGDLLLQIYRDGRVIYEQTHSPGVRLSLASEQAYEIKVWPSASPLAKTVKIRRQDPVPGAAPIIVE
jgi:hypothetical protein